MTSFEGGIYLDDTQEQILDAMVADAKEYFGEDLKDDQLATIRLFYAPIAVQFAQAQDDIGLVLQSAQIENAVEEQLDLLTALIGVKRDPATFATGDVVFSRSDPAGQDYTIPSGTVAQTDSNDPTKYETTATTTIESPSTEDDANTYATTSGTYVTKASLTVDVTHRDTLDVSADIRTTDATTPVAAELEIADATNGVQVYTGSTTSGTFTTSSPTTYDVNALSGSISIEYRLRSGDGATTVELTNSTVDKGGETGVLTPIESISSGVNANAGPNTVTILSSPPAGVEGVTNPSEVAGGTNEETDDSLRSRAQEELSTGSRASAPALIYGAKALDGVKSVSIFINDTNNDNTGTGGLPDHSFELVVFGGNKNEIGQMILETKAAGDTSYGGANGTEISVSTDLPGGQTHSISYSEPNGVTIYIDVDLKKTDEYEGDNAIRDSIVEYIGGLTSGGNEDTGNIFVGDDVLYGRVEYAIRDVTGVYDINSLTVGTSDNPTGTSDVAISYSDVATTDGTSDSVIGITTDNVSL